MAIATQRVTRQHAPTDESEVYQLRQQLNVLVTKFDALCAKLDADAGVTDTNYRATLADAAGAKLVKDWSE